MISVNFAKFGRTHFTQKSLNHGEYIKTYKGLPLDAFEQFVPSNKGKLINDQCFERVVEEMY